jgi:hypothetical protein
MARKKTVKISALTPDDKNFNVGSEFGNQLINKSMKKFGAGRSILLDRNNKIIGGNKTAAAAVANGIDNVQIVESDGKRLIAVKLMNVDLDSADGRELALADNAAAKENIIFDAELVEATLGEAITEAYGISIPGQEVYDGSKSKKENLEPFKKTHILLSFHPQVLMKIQPLLQTIIETEGVEYEQASN